MDSKTGIIVILASLLVLSVLGVNVLLLVARIFEAAWKFLSYALRGVSNNAGQVVNVSSSSLATVAKTSIDLTDGALHDAGNLMQGKSIDQSLNKKEIPSDPKPSSATSTKSPWCLINKQCSQMGENGPCASGKTFGTETECKKSIN